MNKLRPCLRSAAVTGHASNVKLDLTTKSWWTTLPITGQYILRNRLLETLSAQQPWFSILVNGLGSFTSVRALTTLSSAMAIKTLDAIALHNKAEDGTGMGDIDDRTHKNGQEILERRLEKLGPMMLRH